ncbi:MAG: DNA polymerase III subunit alpha [Candidatus Taylorbacteria bacterium RIFCSPHIGHO2_02_FULL_45_28]|uniref:DNA polymerase III subunit alpha n=1 Tax=Candidatus Taylorbacteria bacterium RIFCSPHIGHO2_12_FULL_45_16 TaxID=1802315 RepID=A0A1G2MXZ5_9BACT|nr:MAG: DNA polymerase III subunit alpha [Candidatus Taylorbacteria bacterium RIFCSPHIGHO2_01_FULL_44_110]OHA25273.1 MAG: DNA polymerase III subunit alpha [Candidatus Taylorbacteria bacterium RIFCSPHIGHO2_02_FULL_45_28]OHA28643.1 MAG: DNA polymerase III subunit alpha [Candidatus Taylorbacteria bacterium RIFCSPHIGHO2_12_FULL_45_16]OHA32932.1 MAG: DNA polymerase III subunit alpha [Candidatus Taylorbacteria bacterium RIFCSPLOWO2_01_FULL_45_59]OHA38686.1 MAG: DNA polymerase III subunit alpha [Candi
MSRFTHLHTHSHYSLLSALPKIDELVNEAKKFGLQSLALTDNGNLYGTIEFYKACRKKELKPIIGVDFYVAIRSRRDMQAGIDNRRTRLVLLAINETGYRNLIQLVTLSHLEGFYYKPRIDRELLEKYNEGLICISPSFSGEIVQSLKSRSQDKAKEVAEFYKRVFQQGSTSRSDLAENRLFVEITRHPEIDGHETNMKTLCQFAKSQNIPVMAAHDVYYLKPEDRFARETLVRVNSHSDVSDKISDSDEDDFSFISPERAEELFHDMPEALENTEKISDLCNLDLELGKWVFPELKIESGRTPDDELCQIVFGGFAKRNIARSEALTKRADYELKVIKDKGYAPYFLVVADMLRFARENKILSNIRGSVSGSLITYLAGITNINPIEYEIPFERFLNPDRPSPPDIDMDYADDQRDEIIEYVRKKYGADKVAQIGTFGTMAARGSVRDVARAMGFPYEVGDRISKLIPMGSQGFPMTIERALEETPELKTAYRQEEDTRRIIDMAKKIEGCARHIGVHAAGVVIAPTALTNYTPLQFDPKGEGKIITQYDMYSIEEAGLLKFDFLGLKNLTIITDTITRVKKIDGIEVEVDTIPVDDKKTFEMLARGETADLFQLNGDGMTRFLKDLKPSTIHDINAMVALYRPGPIQFIPEYIARKHDHSLVKYLDPALEKILEKTYGILVYQDDLLMMAHKIAGYSWGEVDKFRKAVGKKIPVEMAMQKEKFIKGCISHSKWSEKKAKEVWKWIEPFAAYGFNKAHSVSYGRVAYITAYLKAHFPEIYLSAVLTSEQGDTEKVAETIAECKRIGIPVLPPDLNESFSQFTVIKGSSENYVPEPSFTKYRIRFGLVTIKNFGQGISTVIINERKRGGRFTSITNFLDRVKDKNLNKKSLESLIKAGAMDCFGEDRGVMLANIDLMLKYNKENNSQHTDQNSLFGAMADNASVPTLRLIKVPDAETRDKLTWEKELLGLYISGHPLERYREIIAKNSMDIKKAFETIKEGATTILAGIITEVRTIQTKNNEAMAFITIQDFSGSSEAVVFPRVYREFQALIVPDRCVAIKAIVNTRNGEKGFIIERVKGL